LGSATLRCSSRVPGCTLSAVLTAAFLSTGACTAKQGDPPAKAASAGVPLPVTPIAPRGEKRGDVLLVTLTGGRQIEFRDRPVLNRPDDDTAVRIYEYVRFEPAIRQHIVEVGFWEGRQTLLLDDRTAARVVVCALPVISPSGHRLACGDTDIAYGSGKLEVWRVDTGGVVQEFSTAPKRLPCKLTWVGDARLHVGLCDFDWSPWGRQTYGLNGSTWRLETACGGIEQPLPPQPRPPESLPPGCEQGERPVP